MRQTYARYPMLLGLALTATLAGPLSAQAASDPLDGTEWELMTVGTIRPIPGTHFYIRFGEGRVSGNAGCNGFFGSYENRGDSITVTDISVQKMMCHEPAGLMGQESYLLRFLEAVREFRLVEDVLRLIRPDHEALTFVPRRLE